MPIILTDGTTPEDSLEVIGNKVENDKAFPVTERKSTPDGVVGVVEEEEEEPPLHPAPIALNEEDQDTPTTPPEMGKNVYRQPLMRIAVLKLWVPYD